MLGIILLYFVGKQFYDLAEAHRKNAWGFAIASIVAYYGGTFMGGILLAVLNELFGSLSLEDINLTGLNLIAIPFGLAGCWIFYRILKHSWSRETAADNSDLLDDEILQS